MIHDTYESNNVLPFLVESIFFCAAVESDVLRHHTRYCTIKFVDVLPVTPD
jgi:hypothetical protein